MRVLADTKDMSKEDWLKYRKKGIGGSDSSAILGANPYSSAFDVYLDKTGDYEEEVDNERMLWGRILEDIVAKEFTKRTGIKLRKRFAILQHDEYDWMIANVDRLVVGEDAGAEIKTTNSFYDEKEVPDYYWTQCQHYMAVTGKAYWYLIVLAGGQKLHSYKVKRDDEFINNKLIPAEKDFWEMLQKGEMPAVDSSQSCTNALNRMYSNADEEQVELPEDVYELLKEYDEAVAQEKEAKERKDLIANTVKSQMGEHSRAVIFDRQVTWVPVTSNKFDSKTFKTDHPDLYEKYLKESNYRRFQIK